MKEYNKLVRDNIPKIMEQQNKNFDICVLNDDEYFIALNNKLQEELNEYLESGSVEELADLQEVIDAILNYKHISKDEFNLIKNAKLKKRGGFEKKIMLKKVY